MCTCVHARVLGAARSRWLLGTGEATCASAAGHRGSCMCCRSQALENHAHGRSLPKNTRGPGRRTSFSYNVCLIPHWQSTLTQLGKEKYLKDLDTFLQSRQGRVNLDLRGSILITGRVICLHTLWNNSLWRLQSSVLLLTILLTRPAVYL